jgi:hypothetical protein
MKIGIYEEVIKDVDLYVKDIFSEGFEDIDLKEDGIFKNIQLRFYDELFDYLLEEYPTYSAVLNFVRSSTKNQEEPNWLHTDDMMGDLTAVLYLSKTHPNEDGTTLYHKNKKSCILKSAYNRLVVFPSHLYHSRNIYENFGKNEDARLIQVCFLKKNDE